jgi:hypothetical protein
MGTPPKKPKPPANLGAAGAALWAHTTTEYLLEPSEVPMLEAACRQADDVAALEAAIERDGLIVAGSAGQPRLNAAVTEVRQGRIALQKLIGAIAFPNPDPDAATLRTRQARAAAHARWRRV